MLELKKVDLSEAYRKKFHISMNDFCHLCKDGKEIKTLYRTGGYSLNLNDEYFILIKYSQKGKSLGFCILDKNGTEVKIFENLWETPCLYGVVYGLNNEFYNIKTGELYCHSYECSSHYMESDNFLFLDSKFNKDPNKRGVFKIDKRNGNYEIIN